MCSCYNIRIGSLHVFLVYRTGQVTVHSRRKLHMYYRAGAQPTTETIEIETDRLTDLTECDACGATRRGGRGGRNGCDEAREGHGSYFTN
ncbi:hypothetical protein RR46_05051 [Papilio xuthus]|uniref:Uncharacterized protein n=1 Tax=Papilio xuthus TaxID=66420 RepID=A0A194PU36_PAPXU|nr:hypothetical protein RR46_05051 [Papilio xuthus]